jgi:hypothetical protein
MRGEPARCVRHSSSHASLSPLADRQRDILAQLLSKRCCLLDLMPAARRCGRRSKGLLSKQATAVFENVHVCGRSGSGRHWPEHDVMACLFFTSLRSGSS